MGFLSVPWFVGVLLTWLLWAAVRPVWRLPVLGAACLAFVLLLSQPATVAVLFAVALVAWLAGRRPASWAGPGSGIVAIIAVLLAVRIAQAWFGLTSWALVTGASYFGLQAAGYLADRALGSEAERRPWELWVYLAWFPKFVQGPFERLEGFKEQLARSSQGPRAEDIRQGLLLITWGLFEKMVVAERLADLARPTFSSLATAPGPRLWGAGYVFALQLFADFSGYTDLAIGLSTLFGIRLSQNFRAPFLATSVADFWRRWHISLSDWVKDYIFVPLQILWRGRPLAGTLAAMLVAYLFVGLWHGIGAGFILLGVLQAFWMGASLLTRDPRKRFWRWLGLERSGLRLTLDVVVTFHLTCLSFLCFKAADAAGLAAMTRSFGRGWDGGWASAFWNGLGGAALPDERALAWAGVAVLFVAYAIGRKMKLLEAPPWVRYPGYAVLALSLGLFGRFFAAQGFLYARF